MTSVEDVRINFKYGDVEDDSPQTRDFYFPGEEVRGMVEVHLRSRVRVLGLTVYFLGTSSVSWEATTKNKVYQSAEIYMEAAKPLLDTSSQYQSVVDLQRGVHQFGFRYLLPADLPSTFNGTYGQVTYLAKVKLTSEDEINNTITSEPFMVLRRPELPPEVYEEKSMKKSKYYFGWNTGKILVECSIDKSAAVPGDNVAVDCTVTNWTDRGVQFIQAALILESHYYAQGHEIVFRQFLSKRDDVFDVTTVRGRRWHKVLLPVPPYLADSGLDQCSIMDVKYIFQFKVKVEGKDDIILETPLYVGLHSQHFGPGDKALLMGKMWQGIRDLQDDIPEPGQRGMVMPWYGKRAFYSDSIYSDFDVTPRSLRY